MQVKRLAGALGAEVSGCDLSQPLPDTALQELKALWAEHLVLRFRNQRLSPEQLLAFSRRFGALERHDNYMADLRHETHPELLRVKATNVKGEKIVFGQQWHSDLSYTTTPSLGSCLYALRMPSRGGDTLFASMIAAYETLSPAMQRFIDPLHVVHDITNGRIYEGRSWEQYAQSRDRNPPVVQPMVRVHPPTGRKALFVSEWMCRRVVELAPEEGESLLRFLFGHCARPEFAFRQCWQPCDLLMWDNRATIHMALADYAPGEPRELLRTSLVGEPLGQRVEGTT
jgi:taurine dioxygenase